MKFGQLIDYNKSHTESHAENETGRLVPGLFLFFFKKALYQAKASGLQLSFNIVR